MKNLVHRITSLTVLFAGALLLVSCGGTGNKNNAVVSGVVKNAKEGTKLYFESLGVANAVVVDSVQLDQSGSFSFNPKLGSRSFYRVNMNKQAAVLLLLDSTEKVELEINAEEFSSDYKVTGSEESRLLSELSAIIYNNYLLKDSMNTVYKENYTNFNQTMMDEFTATLQKFDDQLKVKIRSFISANNSAVASLVAIEQLNVDEDFEIFKMIDENLGSTHPESPYYQAFHTKFEYNSKFTVGSVAPEIMLPNPEGNTTSLSSLQGKIVLIDFWASWCKPCRMENPNVVRLYNQYKGENFEIFSVSLDRDRAAWLQAIEQDNMDWMHVSDLKFWQSPVVSLYNIKGIPHTLLIDEKGTIIAKNLRGESLAEKLNELFG